MVMKSAQMFASTSQDCVFTATFYFYCTNHQLCKLTFTRDDTFPREVLGEIICKMLRTQQSQENTCFPLAKGDKPQL